MARMMDSLIIEPFPPFAFTKITTTTHRTTGRNSQKKCEGNNASNGSVSGSNGATNPTSSTDGNRPHGSSLRGIFTGPTGNHGATVGIRLKSQVPTQGIINNP